MSKKIALVLVLAAVVAGCQRPQPVVQPVVTPEPVFAGKYGS